LGKRCGRVNIMQIVCTQVCKWKSETWWNYSRNGGREKKGQWWRGWIQVWHIWYIVKTFANATVYPHPAQKKKKKLEKKRWEKEEGFGHQRFQGVHWVLQNKRGACIFVRKIRWTRHSSFLFK
jgi:hypothetical protein